MLITIIAWIYITFLSYNWGRIFFRLVVNSAPPNLYSIHPSIVCFTGLALIAAVAGLLSFFVPLGVGAVQLAFVFPAIVSLRQPFFKVQRERNRWATINVLLFTCCVILVLVMSTYTISHPDSLGYHVQIIKWIEEYAIVPGLANLNARLGFQSDWFLLCSLFNFKFTGAGSYVYLNSLVTLWTLFFVISKINYSFTNQKIKECWLWVGFIFLTLGSYTQIPLTATSASPDYIAALYTWLTLYLLHNSKDNGESYSLAMIVVFSFFAFCVKLSTAPIAIAGAYALMQLMLKRRTKVFIWSVALTSIMVLCFLIRNAVTSGYILYPSTFPDIVNADWKVPENKAQRERAYVTAFARAESGASNEDIAFTNNMQLKEWLPIWWSKRAPVDKVILILAGLSGILLIASLKKLQEKQPQTLVCIFTAVTGVVFWFIMGPDPRFGFGFIIGLIALTLNIAISKRIFEMMNYKLIFFTIAALNMLLAVYITHRFNQYFSYNQLVHAAGVKLEPGSSINCENTLFYMAAPFKGCGANPIPCIQDSCKYFLLRGNSITDGFKPRATY